MISKNIHQGQPVPSFGIGCYFLCIGIIKQRTMETKQKMNLLIAVEKIAEKAKGTGLSSEFTLSSPDKRKL